MFNLTKVYATISFEPGTIKVLVIDSEDKKPNFIFFDKINLDYSYDFNNIINVDKINKSLYELTRKVDKFCGTKIHRYIINIPFLDTTPIEYTSDEYDVELGVCSNEFKLHLVEQTKMLGSDDEEYIQKDIISWNLDGKTYKEYPLNIEGKKISCTIISYCSKKIIYNNINNIFMNNNIHAISYVTNKAIDEIYGKKNLVWIDDRSTHIYCNKEHTILPFGLSKITKGIKNALGIKDGDLSLSTMSKIVSTLAKVDIKTPIMNFYDNDYMSFKPLYHSNLIEIIRKQFDSLIADILFEYKYKSKNSNIIITGSDMFYQLIKSGAGFNIPDNCELVQKNESVLLNDENLNSILNAYYYVSNKQNLYASKVIYSTDPFIASNNDAWKKGVILKFGIMSTNFVAKLGQQWQ